MIEPLVVLDKDLHVVTASRSFYETFGLCPECIDGQPFTSLANGQWDIPQLRDRLARIVPDHGVLTEYEVDQDVPMIGRRIMLLNARAVLDDEYDNILLAFEDVTQRRAVERQTRELLLQKDVLLQEMRHRIANSLQIIASIFSLKARSVNSAETRGHLQEAYKRVMSIAAMQDQLRDCGRNASIAVAPHLTTLCSTLAQSLIDEGRPVALDVAADAGTVSTEVAMNMGLVITEVIINSLKHAFPVSKPDDRIAVSYEGVGSGWTLVIRDNGVGKRNTNTASRAPGLGTSIINALACQLAARVDVVSDASGTIVSITHVAPAPAS